MSKIEPIGKGWSPQAALRDAIEVIGEEADTEVLILFRMKGCYSNHRSANLSNADAAFIVDEFKNGLFHRCHDCKCEGGE